MDAAGHAVALGNVLVSRHGDRLREGERIPTPGLRVKAKRGRELALDDARATAKNASSRASISRPPIRVGRRVDPTL